MKKIFKFMSILAFLSNLALAETLKIGTAANYPPFEYINEMNQITGFDMDLLKEIARRAEFDYEIVNMSFDALIPALKVGKVNGVISAVSATPERIKSLDFTDAYYVTENIFLKRVENDKINSKEDLKGEKIGVQLGTVQEIAAKQIEGVEVAVAEEMGTMIMALKAGKVGAVLTDSVVGYGYLKKHSDLAEFYKEADGSEGFSMAFDKNKQTDLIAKINAAIAEIKKDGTFDEILKKYDLK